MITFIPDFVHFIVQNQVKGVHTLLELSLLAGQRAKLKHSCFQKKSLAANTQQAQYE